MGTTEGKKSDSKSQESRRVDPSELPNPWVREEPARFFPSKQKRSTPGQ